MPEIRFSRLKKDVFSVGPGANLMRSLLDHGIPVASPCNGDGVCGKCKIKVVPESHLTPMNETEILLREKYQIQKGQRISCQTQVLGDIEVDATYW